MTRLLGKNFLLVERIQLAAFAKQTGGEEEEMKQQQRMTIVKDLIKKIRSKGRMDAQNRSWVAELPARDCEKAWTHTGCEDTMQKWYE